MGSVPNCRKQIAVRYPIRWFKCKLKPPKNQKGVEEYPEQVREYIKKELEQGSIIGPFAKNPFGKSARFLPLDTRPKKNSHERRIILNLSYPFQAGSVNESINKEVYAGTEDMELRYPSVDNLAQIVRRKGKKARIFIRNLWKAYRQLWMCAGSIHLLGWCFENKFYFDVMFSMGSKSAAFCCQKTTSAITYIFGENGYDSVNYLDNLQAAEMDSRGDEAYDCLGWILSTIGIKELTKKATPPVYIAVFLGILFNTISMTLQITPDRLAEIKILLENWMTKQSATLKEMQSLLGKLNFAASTVRSGRIFVSRLINVLSSFPKHGRRKVSREIRKDIEWWLYFMEDFDGITIMPQINWDAPDTVFSSDANLTTCGGHSYNTVFYKRFPAWLLARSDISINEKELITVVVALKLWRNNITNRNILACCDNQVSVEVVNSGKARNRFTQACLHEICFILVKSNAVLKLVHISSESNRIADCLSRWEETSKREQFYSITKHKELTFLNVEDRLFQFSHEW